MHSIIPRFLAWFRHIDARTDLTARELAASQRLALWKAWRRFARHRAGR